MNAYVTRVVTMSYVTSSQDSKTVSFVQSYNQEGQKRVDITQVPTDRLVRSSDLHAVALTPEKTFSEQDILN